MKYSIGDKVKLKEDMITGVYYDGIRLEESTRKLGGKVTKVKNIIDFSGEYPDKCYILENMEGHRISDKMLVPVKSKVKKI